MKSRYIVYVTLGIILGLLALFLEKTHLTRSVSIIPNTASPTPYIPQPQTEKVVSRIPLTAVRYNNTQNIFINPGQWSVVYPNLWSLYLVKRNLYNGKELLATLYTLEFIHKNSRFTLYETLTLGGNPYVISKQDFDPYVKRHCMIVHTDTSTPSNTTITMICDGNLVDEVANIRNHSIDKTSPVPVIDITKKTIVTVSSSNTTYNIWDYRWLQKLTNFSREGVEEAQAHALVNFGDIESTDSVFINQVVTLYLSGINLLTTK